MAESAFEVPRVKLGNQGLEVSKLGYGCAGLSGYYNDPVQEEVAIALIHYAFGKGITFFDTSDMYGADHANEKLVGKAENELVGESSMCLLPATTKKQAAWGWIIMDTIVLPWRQRELLLLLKLSLGLS
ncbi:palmitoyltransferase akr1 [Sarracenia purpurea var. burkii]